MPSVSVRQALRMSARPGITRRLRARTILVRIGIIALSSEIRVRDASERATRRTRLALRVSVEPAIAQTRPFIAGEAERMTGAERARRRARAQRNRKCGDRERKCGDNGERKQCAHLRFSVHMIVRATLLRALAL